MSRRRFSRMRSAIAGLGLLVAGCGGDSPVGPGSGGNGGDCLVRAGAVGFNGEESAGGNGGIANPIDHIS